MKNDGRDYLDEVEFEKYREMVSKMSDIDIKHRYFDLLRIVEEFIADAGKYVNKVNMIISEIKRRGFKWSEFEARSIEMYDIIYNLEQYADEVIPDPNDEIKGDII